MSDIMDDLINMNWVAVKSAIQAGELCFEDLISAYLSQSNAQNKNTNALRSIMADSALEQAKDIDKKIRLGEPLPPLAGLPIVIKENCNVQDVPCSAGLSFRNEHIPSKDSAITARLRELGAIILGTSVSDPGAFDVRTREVTHPFDNKLTVGGSSGGSGAALAANMCLAAIGTDTGGSIRIPSACCGVFGLKPTYEAMSMEGIFPLVQSLDHVGPMARCAKDLEQIWIALSGQAQTRQRVVKSVGLAQNWIGEADKEVQQEFSNLRDLLRDLDIEIVDIELPDPDPIVKMHLQIFVVESAAYHLSKYSDQIEYYPQIAKDGFDAAHASSGEDYINACKHRELYKSLIDSKLVQVDLIITPTLACFQPEQTKEELIINGKAINFTAAMVRHTCLFNHTGHPALVMPFPTSSNNLTSLQVVGHHHREQSLFSFARRLENKA